MKLKGIANYCIQNLNENIPKLRKDCVLHITLNIRKSVVI